MTNQPVCGKDETRPVTLWENETVHGHALCHESCVDEHFAAVKALRDRQAAYLDSLPTDPKEAIKAARAIMTPDFEPYPEGVKEALYLSVALESLVNGEGIEGRGLDRDAARFIANRVSTAMFNVMKDLDRLSDVLENPSRFERLE